VKLFRSKQDARLDQAISELRGEQPDAKTLSASAERVWQRLQTGEGAEAASSGLQAIHGCADIRSLLPAFHRHELPPARALIVEDQLRECVLCRSYAHGRGVDDATSVNWRMEPGARGFQWSFARLSFAAAAVALLVGLVWTGRNWYFAGPPGSRARIDSIEGQAYRIDAAGERALKLGDEVGEGEFIRTAANSHAKVRLFDGSEVEMNQRAELAVSASRRDTTIHLDQGSIIVQAAKRRTGHLYVSAPDCTVAVTGTVFSVNSGTKGSRVAVIEGEVHVKHSGAESILHSGDVVATTQSVGVVPVREEIAWSSDLDHELALLAEFSNIRTKLEQVQIPGPRYESKILPLLPADTVLYIGIPNLGMALQQANQIFQQQLSQSKVLQDWWNKSGNSNQHPTPQELIDQIHYVSQYLGDEVVITARGSFDSNEHGPILLAEVRQSGLKDYLQNHLADTLTRPQQGTGNLRVVDPRSLSSLAADERGMIMLVTPNMLVVGGDAGSVRQMNAQLDAGAAVSFVAKQPALMLDDIFSTIGASDPNFNQSLAQTNSELGLNLRDDLASALGGELTLALDGPVLPTPSWKAVVEVNNSGALQLAIEKLVQDVNREAQKSNHPDVTLNQTQAGGRTVYTIQCPGTGLATEYDYTFADGYLIMAPSRALLVAALQTHANGTSLARSASFRALLPSDNQANFSGMIYQNLSPILKPLASQLTSGQLALLQQLAVDAKPSVFCAYGESDRIEVASSGKLFDLNPGLPTLIHLLGLSNHGTSHQANP